MSKGREHRLEAIQGDNRFDVVVVGGGVNGIGVYRELSLQGLRVLLVERNDFASGCSAAPSRMIHGGLRYLENGEFGLVRESLAERDALLRNAPHFVRPLATVIPIANMTSGLFNSAAQFLGHTGKPAQRGALPIKLGLSLYDWVTRHRRTMPKHRFYSGSETRKRWPALTSKAKQSAVYFDAWISHPERLCVEMIRDVEDVTPQSIALNYAEISANEDAFVLTCKRNGRQLIISPSAIVNATGAWLDSTAHSLGEEIDERMVSGTKGSHLILDNPRLEQSLGGHMVYFENWDGRVCIAFPYLGHVLAGSTDIRVPEAKRVRCEEDELEYILDSLSQVFPDVPLDRSDVVFSYSGVRPLPSSDHDFTGRISRGHSVRRLDGKVPQFCMIGGKWTTFRAFAEQVADDVLKELGRNRAIGTADLPIGGGKNYPAGSEELEQDLQSSFGLDAARAQHLAQHYGTTAVEVQQACTNEHQDAPICEGVDYTDSEIRWLVRNEQVETLPDIVLRRTSLAITGVISEAIIDALGKILASEHNLSSAELADQKADLIKEFKDFYGVTPEVLKQRSKERSMECA